jgi:hypothetical protein
MSQLTQTNARELRVTTQCSPYGILEPEMFRLNVDSRTNV